MMCTGTSVFNLITEPWLPVQRRSDRVEHIQPWRINERIGEDPFVAFAWPRPDFNGAAHELLIGLLCTAAAPADEDEWEKWWLDPPPPDVLQQRFLTVAHAFDLDGDGPRFLQDLDPLEGAENKDVAALLIDAPGAQTLRNNADLFVKRGATPVLSRAAAAMALFTLSSYAPSGGAGHRTSLRGGGPMTTLAVATHSRYGAALWGRLWPNVESREQLEARATEATTEHDPADIFPWLAPCRTSNPKAGGRPTTPSDVHPLQVYWGMPRRIRILFENAEGRRCGLTGAGDSLVARNYRTRNYGIHYSEGFEHPLTPYYRQKPSAMVKRPVHPNPGGISYRLWPGLVVLSGDGLREPARVVRAWPHRSRWVVNEARFVVFGYDMDNMKARAWTEGEMPLWRLNDATRQELVESFIKRATGGAATVARLVTGAVKAALCERPRDATGDYGFVAERFFGDTESAFYAALEDAVALIYADPDSDDPAVAARRRWAPVMERAALRLFDEYAPPDGLEDRAMHRHVKARFHLWLALRGRGKAGQALFDGDLAIVSPETTRMRNRRQESA
ncbi:MAG: type I-E CRISPR-associated protein Cse1/CasA [Acidobacteria bacterium]|nr:type I-E CRISPR-associated protein Cse1/CasA [Acidobacteriota bacterium]